MLLDSRDHALPGFAGAEKCSRLSQGLPNLPYKRMRAADWSKRSVERALEASGFEKISWVPLAADGAPDDTEESYEEVVGVFTARLA